ncbi:hypothetical protein BM1_02913 [Bipolaris maydis]|nr:hypothetical protein BM1_02913 [Bipolaris maydis]
MAAPPISAVLRAPPLPPTDTQRSCFPCARQDARRRALAANTNKQEGVASVCPSSRPPCARPSMSASRGANDNTPADKSRQPLEPQTAHAARHGCSSALFRALASPASGLANDWPAVACSTSAGAYSGHRPTDKCCF